MSYNSQRHFKYLLKHCSWSFIMHRDQYYNLYHYFCKLFTLQPLSFPQVKQLLDIKQYQSFINYMPSTHNMRNPDNTKFNYDTE